MRYDSEHKQKTRERVLKAAAKAIRVQGPHRVGVAAVMSKAGLTHGGFYAHFESKDDLIASAIDCMFEEGATRLALEMDGRPAPVALSAYIDFYLSPGHRDAIAAGCPIPALAGDLRRLPKRSRERFAHGVARLTDALARRLAELGHADADAGSEASSMLSELVGALSLARAVPERARSDEMLNASRRLLKQRLQLERRT